MEFSEYVGKRVKIEVVGNIYYAGMVLSCDDNSLTIRDKTGSLVTLKENYILGIREVQNGH